ncbi:adenylyltransferase/cytidyltransferase family protein [Candidatus Pelagibacter sp.]|nr:adenylyltransferase/cytidyltransferase family protein [Candidatus Pelagibacter sp.]
MNSKLKMFKKNILIDMSATIIHHGHIRLINKASKIGRVIIALTRDKEIKKFKGYEPEIKFSHRKEILMNIKSVFNVIPCNFYITKNFLKKYKIDYLVHGNDNKNDIEKGKMIIFNRTKGISSTIIRKKVLKNLKLINKKSS